VSFLNAYFSLQGLPPLARVQDIALHFPEEEADVAFFMKELHRFEENYPGRGLPLLEALRARHLVVSLPTVSLYGGRSLTQVYRRFFYRVIAGKDWQVQELVFPSELAFCVDKGGGR
jgi:16S rRNA (guanine(1405)-N(7))-methyltransferase